MKIMISNDGPHAHFYIRLGWAKVFNELGHEVVFWDIERKPAFDAFDEFDPDIFIGQTYNLTKSVVKCISERPDMKVVMRASDWGDMQNEIDFKRFPVLVAREDEKTLVKELKEKTGKPDFVYNHYHDKWMSQTHNNWSSEGINVVSMLHGADVFDYIDSEFEDSLKSDVSFIGGYWDYKAKSIDKYLIPLCHPVGKYNVKIFGNQGWPVVQYLGFLPNESVKNVFRSATISPNISEPHSQEFGYDIIERPFKVLISKGFCISDYVQSMAEDVFKDGEVLYAKSPQDFLDLIDHYIKNPEEREEHIEKGYNCVLNNHTYFHRVSTIFENLDLEKEKMKCDRLAEFVLGDLK